MLMINVFVSSVSTEQIKNLHMRFQQLCGNEKTLRKEHLENIPTLADNPIKTEIIKAFFDKRNQHNNELGSYEEIGFEEFLMVMSHFRPPSIKTSAEEKAAMRKRKVRFLFNMHDTDGDGKITLEEYRKVGIVEGLLSESESIGQEVARAIADAAMLEVASTNVPNMVREVTKITLALFLHFACPQILKDLEMESRMYVRFLDMNTANLRCGK
uniref:Calcineurin B homologous protein 3 n=1 Tax=Xiphophorus couchianus TaxID=32473 RepID=A0A3B5LZU7_9TELE